MSSIICQGWAPQTRTAHDSAIKQYVQFCTKVEVPLHKILPVPKRVLVAFAASLAGTVAGTTVRNLIAGIKAFHVARNLPWLGSARLRIVIDAVERLCPALSRLPPHPPVTLEMLRNLLKSMPNKSTSFDQSVITVALVAFWGQFRIGELLPTTVSTYSPTYHPTILSWTVKGTLQSIELPWTKTTKSAGAVVPLLAQSSCTCPATAMTKLAESGCRLTVDPATHLFTYQNTSGKLVPLLV